ncbi:lamprin 0.9-like [Hyposmocoma kahamanoa]|uniref:lamprin 0.9-like n=1 Tax=Hyposmocoma kahamanoa TaxID=1477025 RepID=UPI000E6D7559|nr:lamprin 0.9-like [Hyposmocoma kahamanoa]
MNTYITLACLLAVAGVSHGSAIGYGWGGLGASGLGWNGLGWNGLGWNGLGWDGYGWGGKAVTAPAAVSSANLYKAAPIPVLRTWAAPVISAPVYKSVAAPVAPLGLGWSGVNPWGYGYGLGSWGKGWGSWGGWGKF